MTLEMERVNKWLIWVIRIGKNARRGCDSHRRSSDDTTETETETKAVMEEAYELSRNRDRKIENQMVFDYRNKN